MEALTISGLINGLMILVVGFAVWMVKRYMVEVKKSIEHLERTMQDFKLEVAKSYATKEDINGLRSGNERIHAEFWKESRGLSDRLTVVETRQKDRA